MLKKLLTDFSEYCKSSRMSVPAPMCCLPVHRELGRRLASAVLRLAFLAVQTLLALLGEQLLGMYVMADALTLPRVAHRWGSVGGDGPVDEEDDEGESPGDSDLEESDDEEDYDDEVEVMVLQDLLFRKVSIVEHFYDVSEHRHMSERDVRDLATFLQTIEKISEEKADSACELCPTCRARAGLLGRQGLVSRAATLLLHALHRLLAPLLPSPGGALAVVRGEWMEEGMRHLLLQDAASGSLYTCLEHLQMEVDLTGDFLAKLRALLEESAGEESSLACPSIHCRILRSAQLSPA